MSETLDEKQTVSTTQPKPNNKGRPVMDWLMEKLEERRQHGIRKYGAELHSQNGRKPLFDAFEEAEDLLIYLAQALMEIEEIKSLKTLFWLIQISENKKDYKARDIFIYRALAVAREENYKCGIKIDLAQSNWPLVFIEIPDFGQFSWHCQEFEGEWDGHTTEDKYDRLEKFVNS